MITTSTNADWLCPVCGLVRLKYGANCPKFNDRTCENLPLAHITGRWYLQDELNALNALVEAKNGIGISEIANDN